MNKLVGVLIAIIIVLMGALAFVLGRQSMEPTTTTSSAVPAKEITRPVTDRPVTKAAPAAEDPPVKIANASEQKPLPGATPFEEKVDDVTLKFLPTKDFRKLIDYRIAAESDSTCTKVYTASEKVTKITYAYGFVIERFNTWNPSEGQQEYIPFEDTLPRALQGSLHDIVKDGRTVTITTQRCGYFFPNA